MASDEKLIEYLLDMQNYCIRQKKQSFEPEEIERYNGTIKFIADVLSKLDSGDFK